MVVTCLLFSIASGLIAAIYVFIGGGGLMSAFLAYSLVGATVLTASLTACAYLMQFQASSRSSDMS